MAAQSSDARTTVLMSPPKLRVPLGKPLLGRQYV